MGDALRALPVANMLFDERGELRRLVNVYVDGVDIRGGSASSHCSPAAKSCA